MIYVHKTNCKNKKSKNIRFCASNLNLHNILFYLVNDCRYVPSVQMVGNELRKIFFKIKKDVYTIMCDADVNNENNLDVNIDNENDYNNYYQCDKEIYLWMINPDNMSYTNENFINIEEEYTISPMSGYFDDKDICNDQTFIDIDNIKAYSSRLKDMQYFNVFNVFDQWLVYNNEPIDDYSQYIIELTDNLERMEIKISFTQKVSRCCGYKLNRIKDIQYKIHFVRKPSKLNKSNSHDYLRKLYNNPNISIKNKKFIVNKNTGLIEKKYNASTKAGIFKSLDDAHYYKNKLGGTVHYLRNCDEADIEQYHDLTDENEKLYLHKVSNKKYLHEVFKPIKDLIYEMQTVKNYEMYMKLKESNVSVVGVKTDALLITEDDLNRVKNIEFINEKEIENKNQFSTLGKYKIERNKTLADKHIMIEHNSLNLDLFKINQINTINLIDEYDSNELLNKTKDITRLLLKGKNAGAGKTTSAMKIAKTMKTLFVSPQNKLCQKIKKDGFECITFHKLFGLSIYQKTEKKRKLYNIDDYDCIVFDELFMYDIQQLQMIYRFILQHKKRIIATGDIDQLQPFSNVGYNNVKEINKYIKDIVNLLFPNQIELKIIKRFDNEEDKIKMINIKNDIFNSSLKIMDIFTKYNINIIDSFSYLKTTKNISYFKSRADEINYFVHEQIIKQPYNAVEIENVKYWAGLEIVCKEYFKNKNTTLHVNYTYVIEEINIEDNYFVIKDQNEDEEYEFEIFNTNKKEEEICFLAKYFKLPYCSTCHSSQGDTIDEPITIFDCNSPYVDPNYIYTALTRVTSLKNITIFKHNDNEIKNLNYCKLLQYFKIKINGYKHQDKIANRSYDENEYITYDELFEQYKNQKQCVYCHVPFELELTKDNKIHSNITVDRKDATIAHLKRNCVLSCISCNCARR